MPKIRYDVPFWLQVPAKAPPKAPILRGELDADVVVVGGGVTGCLTACSLAAARLSVVLVEAERLGGGTTSRASGLLSPFPSVSFAAIRRAAGLRAARHIYDEYRLARRDLPKALTQLGVRSVPRVSEGVWMARNDAEARDLRREFEAEEEAGLEPQWCPPDIAAKGVGLDVTAALKRPGCGVFNPHAIGTALAAACKRRKVKVFERTPVEAVTFDKDGAVVVTPRGSVSTRRVVVASGQPGQLFPTLRRHFDARETYAVATEVLPAPVRRQFGRGLNCRDAEAPPHEWGVTDDGRVIVQGGEQAQTPERDRVTAVVQRTGQLMYELSRLYPEMSGTRPVAGWSCPVVAAKDGLPLVGSHRAFPHHVFALGLGRSGLVGALVAARLVERHVRGQLTKSDEALGFGRDC